MKKRYIFMIAICAILSILVSCDGSVDEMLFKGDDTEETSWPTPNFDGEWVFQYADKDWIVTSTVKLDTEYVKKGDGFSFDGKVVRYESNDKENIYINTVEQSGNGGKIHYVIINAPNATIRHYGSAGYVEIQSAASYYVYGDVSDLVVSKGEIVIESEAEVKDFSVANGASVTDLTIKVKEPENVGIFAYYNDNKVKVNNIEPQEVFTSDNTVAISSDKVARVGTNTYQDISSVLTTSEVIRLVNDVTLTSGYELAANDTLRVGVNVSLTLSNELTVNGTLENFGTISVNSEKTIAINKSLNNYGTLNNSGTISFSSNSSCAAELVNHGGIINNSGTVTVNAGKCLSNYGTIENTGSLTLTNGGYTPGKLNNYGTIKNKSTITNNGEIENSGTIDNSEGGSITGTQPTGTGTITPNTTAST